LLKKKILIIGSSYTIKRVFTEIYGSKYKIDNISFRESWRSLASNKQYKIIIISGFHFYICYYPLCTIGHYIDNYIKYLNKIRLKNSQVMLISTFINSKYSFSRVVYFYYNLILTLKKRHLLKNFVILTFRKIHFKNNNNIYNIFLKKLLESIFLQFVHIDYFKKNIYKYKLHKLHKINFFFLKFPRPRLIDRILRLI
jgi:hypothetical protein